MFSVTVIMPPGSYSHLRLIAFGFLQCFDCLRFVSVLENVLAQAADRFLIQSGAGHEGQRLQQLCPVRRQSLQDHFPTEPWPDMAWGISLGLRA